MTVHPLRRSIEKWGSHEGCGFYMGVGLFACPSGGAAVVSPEGAWNIDGLATVQIFWPGAGVNSPRGDQSPLS
jgi:hypothetical protein